MKAILAALLLFYCCDVKVTCAQSPAVDKVKFFSDTAVVQATISTSFSKLLRQKKEGYQFPAYFTSALPNGTAITAPVVLEIRGHFRKGYCYTPPLKIIFKNQNASTFSPLGSLKLVSECKSARPYDQYLFKEFLIYKMYNLLTDMSFRVRLLNVNFIDSSSKKKPLAEYAFLIEDIKDVAKRNKCRDLKDVKVMSEMADRRQMTMVALFEYMIGNTDWGVPVNHNTKLIGLKSDTLKAPFVVPYDFDYAGLVDADYAVPDEQLNIQNVQQRLYRGFPRTADELNDVIDVFKARKDNIYDLINNCNLLTTKSKKEMTTYLDDFFDQISNTEKVKYIFIKNARTE